jgi:hypothetical protein
MLLIIVGGTLKNKLIIYLAVCNEIEEVSWCRIPQICALLVSWDHLEIVFLRDRAEY